MHRLSITKLHHAPPRAVLHWLTPFAQIRQDHAAGRPMTFQETDYRQRVAMARRAQVGSSIPRLNAARSNVVHALTMAVIRTSSSPLSGPTR